MSKEIWIWSDQHLGHQNCYHFTNYDGSKMRPWDTYEEAEEVMIQNYNELVKPNDRVYFLGDLGIKTDRISYFMNRLNKCDRLYLHLGNHDTKIPAQFYLKYFDKLRGSTNLENYLLTHIPVSAASKGRFKRCIHGHTHGNMINLINKDNQVTLVPDPWYRNVCVEVTNYRPVAFSEIKEETEKLIQQGIIHIPERGERIV